MASSSSNRRHLRVAIAGNPNTGKTVLFNALTGLRQKVANYPGVTVEKREGYFRGPDGTEFSVLDLPGMYSLTAHSPAERIAWEVLLGRRADTPAPDVAVVIVDASNLERNLYLVTQLIETGLPVVVALNMMDLARANGLEINAQKLADLLGVPVVPMVATRGEGIASLPEALQRAVRNGARARRWRLPLAVEAEIQNLSAYLRAEGMVPERAAEGEALRLLFDSQPEATLRWRHDQRLRHQLREAQARLEQAGIEWRAIEPGARYAWIDQVCVHSVQRRTVPGWRWGEWLDRVLTHRFFGLAIFVTMMACVFQSIYTWARLPMEGMEAALGWVGQELTGFLPRGALQSLLVDGILAGVGAVLVFLPQILFLFFFIGLLEDSGYLARAAFLMDRLMARVGLHGKCFIPLLSCFACAVPGIMATRTIERPRDRLATILVAPLMSCRARLPVYTLMIGAFIPAVTVGRFFTLQGLTLLSMYLLGIVAALGMAALFKRTLLRSETPPLLLELPPYRIPALRSVLLSMLGQTKRFVYRAGTVILAISIVLWFLASYPQQVSPTLGSDDPGAEASARIQHSYAGQLGQLIEPVIRPLGFDWKIGIGLITSFAAREVIISTLATIYNVGEAGKSSVSLPTALKGDIDPRTGQPVFTPLVALSLLVFFVLACQCIATVATVHRETNSWRWPLFMVAYMTVLAYAGSLVVYQVGRLLGYG